MTVAAAQQPAAEVLLIDLSSLFWQAFHATKDALQSEASTNTLNAVRRIAGNDRPLVAVCMDQGRSFRKAMAPEYKAQREAKPPAALAELAKVKERLAADGYLLWGVDGFEADDVIATAATAASRAGHPVRIASADKDLLQLLALPGVTALRTHDWSTWGVPEVVAKFGVEPESLRDWLALVGDASDNVKGAPGVGPKTSTALLLKHYDIDGIYRKIDALVGGQTMTPEAREIATPAVVASLRDFKADVLLARKLVTLRTDAPIEFDEIYQRREPKTKTKGINLDDNEDIPFGNEPTDRSEPKDAKFEDARISGAPTEEPKPEPPKESPTPAPSAPSPAAAPPAVATGAATATSGAASPTSPTTPANETRALVVATGVTYERALEPQTATNALKMAEVFFDSRAYVRYPTAQAIFAAIVGGREIGLPAVASVNAFHFLTDIGCLAMKAHTVIELWMRHPKCKYMALIHSDETYAEYESWHVDHPKPFRHKYTIQDAVDAGLCSLEMVPRTAGPKEKDARGQWDKRRKQMLRKTCGTQVVTILCPGASMGWPIAEDLAEVDDDE